MGSISRGVMSKMTSAQRPNPPQLTHFLCLPLVTPASRPQLSANIASFKQDVIRSTQIGGFDLPADAVRPVGTLHLTLGMMSFPKNKGLERAVNVLQSLQPQKILASIKKPVIPGLDRSTVREAAAAAAAAAEEEEEAQDDVPPKISLTLKGLNSMQKSDKATVLYATPLDPDGTLQRFAEEVKAIFKDAGLLVPEDRPLLLHATIVNTTYVKRKNRHGGKGGDRRIIIKDAQAIMDRYEDHVWMEALPLEKLAICKMGAKPVEENGVLVDAKYEVVAEVDD